MVVSRGIAFTKSLSHDSRAFINGISDPYKKKHSMILFLRKKVAIKLGRGLTSISAGILMLNIPVPGTKSNKVCLLVFGSSL